MNRKDYLFIGVLCLLKCFSVRCYLVLSICPVGKVINTHENKDLNLTCKVTSEEKLKEQFNLSWKLPSKTRHEFNSRVSNTEHTITILGLRDDDSGQYICELNYDGKIQRKKISVNVKSRKCFEPFFDCGNNLCIPKNFVCDGYIDCPGGFDESFNHCGPDACREKVLCDGRCIPKELCCDVNEDVNCTVSYVMPCCHKVLSPKVEAGSSKCTASVECHYGQMFGFGNSMLYIVASCAIVVMLVSSIFMIIVCRICARSTDDFQRWSRSPSSRHHQCSTMINHMDANVNNLNEEECPLDDSVNYMTPSICNIEQAQSEDFVLLNFVPGYGFEVAECRPKPPPYSERTIGFPPPPYASMVDVSNEDAFASDSEAAGMVASNSANS